MTRIWNILIRLNRGEEFVIRSGRLDTLSSIDRKLHIIAKTIMGRHKDESFDRKDLELYFKSIISRSDLYTLAEWGIVSTIALKLNSEHQAQFVDIGRRKHLAEHPIHETYTNLEGM